ncbi:MAG: tetratricopeptide repeat protein, partial [Bryobacteraceae bacterium]
MHRFQQQHRNGPLGGCLNVYNILRALTVVFRKGWVSSLLVSVLLAASGEVERARKLFNKAAYEESLKVLQQANTKDPEVHSLAGRNYYMLGEFRKASESFEKAVSLNPSSSVYEHWLGKAYGKRAETSSPFTAPGYASKTRKHFERAVELDPKNIEAINDLLEYYLQAPGFLGGGVEKAEALAERVAQLDVAEGYWARAHIAEQRKEFAKAETQLRRAVEAAPMQIGRVVDLAKFLARQGKYQESEKTFQQAEKIDPNNP